MGNIKRSKGEIFFKEIQQLFMLTVGAVVAAIGLELFLVPNDILDGGVIGLSIIASALFGTSMSVFIVLLNIPFAILGFIRKGKKFTLHFMYAIVALSLTSKYLHHFDPVTQDKFLATIIGAVILGAGIGIAIRFGAALDGTEIVAILISKKSTASVGQIIMIMNLFIFTLAALVVFSWETAMYSLITYFLASKVIDMVSEGMNQSISVTIISDIPDILASEISNTLGRSVTFINGEGAYSNQPKKIIYMVITRIELADLRAVVTENDPNSIMAINHINEISGGGFKKRQLPQSQ